MSEALKLQGILAQKSADSPAPEQVILKDAYFLGDEKNVDLSEESSYFTDDAPLPGGENMSFNQGEQAVLPINEQQNEEEELELRVWDTLSEEDLQGILVKPKFWRPFIGYNILMIGVGLGLGVFLATLILDGSFDKIYHVLISLRNTFF